MLDFARSICAIYYSNECRSCPLKTTCKQKISLSKEEVEVWIVEMEGKAKEVLGR